MYFAGKRCKFLNFSNQIVYASNQIVYRETDVPRLLIWGVQERICFMSGKNMALKSGDFY